MGNIGKKMKKSRVLLVGLDNAGKSSVVNWLKPTKEKANEIVATVGFETEQVKHAGMNMTMFDMSGQGRYRSLWEHYYAEAEAIIFVVDSSDRVRMCVAQDELACLVKHKDISGRAVPILFFANKMDLPEALSAAEISQLMQLPKVTDRAWRIVQSNALTGKGLEEGMKWLEEHVA